MEERKKKLHILCLVLLALLAVAVRAWQFGSVPGGMNQDGAMAAVDAKALAEYGTDRLGMVYPVHLTAWGFGQMSALLSYLMVPFVRLFGLSVVSARLPQLLVSLGALVLVYLLARELFSREAARAVLFLAVICPWHIVQSRWALDCNLFPHFFLAGVFFLCCAAKGRRHTLSLSMLCFALSMYSYGISIYTVPPFLLIACILLLRRRAVTLRQAFGALAVYLLVAWPFLLCMILNTFGLESIETPFFTIPVFPNSLRAGDILFFSSAPLAQLRTNALAVLQILSQRYDGSLCNEVPGFGTLYMLSLPFQIWGFGIAVRRAHKDSGCMLLVLWFLIALFSGLITASVNINRINLLFYPLIFFAGLGLRRAGGLIRHLTGRTWFSGILPAAFLLAFSFFTHAYFTTYAQQISLTFMEDFGQAVASLKDSEAAELFITPDAQFRGTWYVSEVLTLFYQDIDAKDYQSDAFDARYHFYVPEQPDPSTDAVYVLSASDVANYSSEDFLLTAYGRFTTAVPKAAPSE